MSRSPLHHLAHPMLALAGLTAVVSVPFGFMGDYGSLAPSALARTSPFVIGWLLESVAFLVLAVAVAGLADHHGRTGRGLGAWAVALGLVAAVAGFFERAFHAFLQPALASAAPALLDHFPGGILAVGVFGSLLLTVAGLATFAVSAMRSQVMPRAAAVLVLVGAVAFPLQSAATLLLGAGLLWAGIAGLRVRPTLSEQPA